jgi:replicative DNA helicase
MLKLKETGEEVKMQNKKKPILRIDEENLVDFGKVAPQAQDLEVVILGALLLEKRAIDQIVDFFNPEMFYNESNKIVAKSIWSLYQNNEPIDILTVVNRLKKNGELETIGGAFFIASLTNRIATSANIEFHARIVCQEFIKREIIMMSAGMIKESYADGTDALEILETGQKLINDVSNSINIGKSQTVEDLFFESEKRNIDIRNKQGMSGVPSGFVDLDKLTGGWQSSDLIILAARPAMGKTSLMMNFVRNAAVDNNIPTAVFSLEMSAMQLFQRLQSSESGIPLEKYMRKGLNDEEVQRNRIKCGKLTSAPIYIDDTGGLSIFEFKVKLRKLKKDHGIKFCVIDYVQLMTVGKGADINGREQEVSYISRNLKSIAKDLNIPILILSQLSRAVEKREDKEPILSDLRESGSLEQDADMVMFIYRPEYYGITEDDDNNSTLGKAKLRIAKHRNGSLDDVLLGFDGELTKFTDHNPYFEEPLEKMDGAMKPANEDFF